MRNSQLKFSDFGENDHIPILVQEGSHAGPVQMHSHDFYEVVYVKEGFTIHYYGESTTVLTEGDIFVIAPGIQHAYTGLHYTLVYNCLFTDEAVSDLRENFRGMPGMDWLFHSDEESHEWMRVRLDTAERMRVMSVLERMRDEQENKRLGWQIMMKSLLVRFLTLFSRSYAAHYLASTSEKIYLNYVVRVLNYIEANFSGDIDLNLMAEHVDISPDYLSRQFKKVMGLSPAAFLRSYRLARAMDLIRADSTENFGVIAHTVGYKHLSHFSREFKLFTGMTPSEYKNNYYNI